MKWKTGLLAALGTAAAYKAIQQVTTQNVNLYGKVVLITGGSRGLGFALARAFAEEGCEVIICARDQDVLAEAQHQLTEAGHQVMALPCDVSDRVEIEALIRTVIEQYGRLDVLVCNAGVIQVAPIQAMRVCDFEEAMGTNFWGELYPTLAVIPHMQERGHGQIVHISSIGGKVSLPHMLPYTAAKFAITGFSEGLRAELLSYGIRVTTVIPGLMRTGSFRAAWFKGQVEKEFAWFTLLQNSPISSIAAESAAQQILAAIKRGDAEIILSPQAQLVGRLYDLFPNMSIWVNSLLSTLLPSMEGGMYYQVRGDALHDRLSTTADPLVVGTGEDAAHEFNQYAAEERVGE